MRPLRVLILTVALLTATLVFAPPAQAAVDPCYKDDCVITYVDDGYACAGTVYKWETYGICAGADPACVGVRSGRNWQETCVPPQPAAKGIDCQKVQVCPIVVVSPERVCAGAAIGLQGAAGCVEPVGCVTVHYGFNQDKVCVQFAQAANCKPVGCVGPVIVVEEERVCAGWAHEYGGHAVCVESRGVCVITAGAFWYNEECTSDYVASTDPCDHLGQCPVRPIVGSGPFGTCVGVAFQIGGAAECVDLEKGCVTHVRGYSYSQTCVAGVGVVLA